MYALSNKGRIENAFSLCPLIEGSASLPRQARKANSVKNN